MGCAWSSADLAGDGLRIRIVKEIARGGFSQVYLAEDIDSQSEYAVKKIMNSQSEDERKSRFEADLHRKLESLHIIPLLAWIEADSAFHLVFPFCRRGTLSDELAKRRSSRRYFPQTEVLRYLEGVSKALRVVHEAGVAHRDLKTANILLADDGTPMLTDFGSAIRVPVTVEDARSRQKWVDDCAEHCSMPYRAPELFSCDIGTVLDHSVDLWSLGCCLYAFCFFVSPFDLAYEKGDSVALAVQNPHKIPYALDSPYNSELFDIIRSLLVVEPKERIGLEEVFRRIEHLGKDAIA